MTSPQIIYASSEEPINDILERIGIETIREEGQPVRWLYKDKMVLRPVHANNWTDDLLKHFNIQIEFQDPRQLPLL